MRSNFCKSDVAIERIIPSTNQERVAKSTQRSNLVRMYKVSMTTRARCKLNPSTPSYPSKRFGNIMCSPLFFKPVVPRSLSKDCWKSHGFIGCSAMLQHKMIIPMGSSRLSSKMRTLQCRNLAHATACVILASRLKIGKHAISIGPHEGSLGWLQSSLLVRFTCALN